MSCLSRARAADACGRTWQGPGYLLPSRSRLGDDTPGHKADPTKRGAAGRSKPAGLMFLALQSVQQEERQMASQGHTTALALQDSGGIGGLVGLAGGDVGGGVYEHMDAGMREPGASDTEGMGSVAKLQQKRKRSNKTNSRVLDRKSALSMRLKFHWKAKDVALSEARKQNKVNGASALKDGECRQVVMDGQQVMGAALRTMEAAGGSAEASRAAERRLDEGPGGVAGPGVQQLRGLSHADAQATSPGQPPPPPPMDGRAARSQPEHWH